MSLLCSLKAINFFGSKPKRALVSALFLLFSSTQSTAVPTKAYAVSPMPYELEKEQERKALEKPSPSNDDINCRVTISYLKGKNGKDDYLLSTFFDCATQKRIAFERTIEAVSDKLSEEDVSDVVIECRFPEHRRKE